MNLAKGGHPVGNSCGGNSLLLTKQGSRKLRFGHRHGGGIIGLGVGKGCPPYAQNHSLGFHLGQSKRSITIRLLFKMPTVARQNRLTTKGGLAANGQNINEFQILEIELLFGF